MSNSESWMEVKVDNVQVTTGSPGASIVSLRVLETGHVLLVHIGDNESSALIKEMKRMKQMRPLTHDVAKEMLCATGNRVTRICIHDIINNTYYARIYIAHNSAPSVEKDVDARPSDAINLAVRFGAPMFVRRSIADIAAKPVDVLQPVATVTESQAEIIRSVRQQLTSFEDPTVMFQLKVDLAIKENRFEDAHSLQQSIFHEMTHNSKLRLVVAMEAALADGRYDEAAKLRDEYKMFLRLRTQTS
ncbi:MAG: hypothetical protein WDW38_004226 [Sanguina aurantia]